jgi:hypothetical protein
MNSLLDVLKIDKMASGHLCLNLSKQVNWDTFPDLADQLLGLLGGCVLQKNDGPDMRLWQVRINGCDLRLVFDDYPLMTSLESSDVAGDELIKDVHRNLMNAGS